MGVAVHLPHLGVDERLEVLEEVEGVVRGFHDMGHGAGQVGEGVAAEGADGDVGLHAQQFGRGSHHGQQVTGGVRAGADEGFDGLERRQVEDSLVGLVAVGVAHERLEHAEHRSLHRHLREPYMGLRLYRQVDGHPEQVEWPVRRGSNAGTGHP